MEAVPSSSAASIMRHRLLLIAFHYPPIQGSSGFHRALAFSKHLPCFGWDVSILTVHARAHENIAADNLQLIPNNVTVIRAATWDAARHFSIFGRYPSFLAIPDRWSSWVPFAIHKGMQAHHEKAFSAIWSTFPIASAHVIGGHMHRKTKIPWVADFRDPMATPNYPHELSLRRRWTSIQDLVVRESSHVVTTTSGAADFYRQMYPDASPDHFSVIENGFDPEFFGDHDLGHPTSKSVSDPMLLLHSGVLYPRERDPLPFFRALRRLIDAGAISSASLRVVFRASGFDEQYESLLNNLRLSEIVTLAPALPYSEALREMQAASALLLFQASVCNNQIPAKAYEYLFAGRPILGLTDPAGDTGQLLRRFRVPGIAFLEKEDDIFHMLCSALPAIHEGRYPVPSRKDVMTVSRKAGAQRLAGILNRLVAPCTDEPQG